MGFSVSSSSVETIPTFIRSLFRVSQQPYRPSIFISRSPSPRLSFHDPSLLSSLRSSLRLTFQFIPPPSCLWRIGSFFLLFSFPFSQYRAMWPAFPSQRQISFPSNFRDANETEFCGDLAPYRLTGEAGDLYARFNSAISALNLKTNSRSSSFASRLDGVPSFAAPKKLIGQSGGMAISEASI